MALTTALTDSNPEETSTPLVYATQNSSDSRAKHIVDQDSGAQPDTTTGAAADNEQRSVAEERDRLSARVFELENRLRETEEELEYYFDFYKKSKRGKCGTSKWGRSSARSSQSRRTTSSNVAGVGGQEAGGGESDEWDSDLEDGAAPGNLNYTGES